jgi:hypothetical protein
MKVNLRSVTGISLICLATVAGVSATAWFAMDRAGRDLIRADVAPPDPSAGPAAAVTAGPRGTPVPASSAGLAGPQDKSVRVPGGQVSVRCQGTTTLLRGAQPDDGWRVEVDSSGPGRVLLRFTFGDGNALRAIRVDGVCMRGVPVFTLQGR